jgi:hypothetical protein
MHHTNKEIMMNIPYNAYEINQARIQQMLEGENRERLADIARAGSAKPSRIVRVMSAFQRVAGAKRASSSPSTALVNKVRPAANG